MNLKDKKETIKRYEGRLEKYGVSMKTLGWKDKKQQYLRFHVLSQIDELNNSSILDIGCGFGNYYKYLIGLGLSVNYTGYDISPKLIEIAKKKNLGAKFEIKDILRDKIENKFDYVFSSGVLNARLSNNERFAKNMIRKMFQIAKKGIAVNMMTDYVDFKERHLYYYSPEKIFSFCKKLTRWVVLRHDYPLYEFTIYLLKSENNIYKKHKIKYQPAAAKT